MQLTQEQLKKLNKDTTEGSAGFATLAHLDDKGAHLVFSDNSMESVLVGDSAFKDDIGTRIHFSPDGKIFRTVSPTYKAPAPKTGCGSCAPRRDC